MSFNSVSASTALATNATATSASAASAPAVAISGTDSLVLKVMDYIAQAFNHLTSMHTSFSESSETREETMQRFKTFALASGKISLIDQISLDISMLRLCPRIYGDKEGEIQEKQKSVNSLVNWLEGNQLDIPLDLRLSRDRMIKKIFAMICGHEFFAKMPVHHSGGKLRTPRPTSEQLKNTPFIREFHTVESGKSRGLCIEYIWIRAMADQSSKSNSSVSQSMAVCIELDGQPDNDHLDQSSPSLYKSHLYISENQSNPVFNKKRSMKDILFYNPAFVDRGEHLMDARDFLDSFSSSWFIRPMPFFSFAQQLAGLNLYYNSGFPEYLRDQLQIPNDLIPIILDYSLAIPSLQIDFSDKQPTYRNFFDKKDPVASASDPAQK